MKRSLWWRAAAAVFVVLNGGGAIYAAVRGEIMHATVHVALLVVGYGVWQMISGRRHDDELRMSAAEPAIEQLQHSVDAIALEVERIGEMQRFINKSQQEKTKAQSENGS